jgi:hypothetical protein
MASMPTAMRLSKFLAKQEPREERGEDALEVEQQRCRRGRRQGESQHQEYRAEDAAECNRAGEPRGVAVRRPRDSLATRTGHAPRCQHDREPDARARIQEPGQHDRRHFADETLGERRAGAEQHGGEQRKGNT